MHAEVLAKKGFMLYIGDCLKKNRKNIFESENISIHLYVSSSPCGNSVIKKWAKPTLGSSDENIPSNKWPPYSKQKFYYTAKHEGQGCLLLKKNTLKEDRNLISNLQFPMPAATGLWFPQESKDEIDEQMSSSKACKTYKPFKYKHSFTCSDKILFWQHLGLQGSKLLISGCFQHPLRLSTITIGRKFSEPHLIRALYGRYSPSKALVNEGAPDQQPIVCLVTCLKFDESTYSGVEKSNDASFSDPRCYWWCKQESSDTPTSQIGSITFNEGYQEILDGRTGKIYKTDQKSKLTDIDSIRLMDHVYLNNTKTPYYSETNYKKQKKLMLTYFESVRPNIDLIKDEKVKRK